VALMVISGMTDGKAAAMENQANDRGEDKR
jgi:hypothetical protein